MRVWRPDSVSTVTAAPMASRLLLVPRKRNAIDGGRFSITFFKQAQLRGVAIFQKHFLPAILIEIGEGKRSAILEEIQPYCAGNVGKCSIPIVRIENIPLEAAPGAVGPNEFVDGTPSLFVIM